MAETTVVEICVDDVDDAALCAAAGVDRVELNAALDLGGLTPTPGTVAMAIARCQLPIIAMARPRGGGFFYSASEFAATLRDIEWLVDSGVAGIACGALTETGELDVRRCREMVRIAGKVDKVLHRAFDMAADPIRTLETAIDLGFARILTSGGAATAMEGVTVLRRVMQQAAGRIEILPAAGIRAENVRSLLKQTDCRQVHASLRIDSRNPVASESRFRHFETAPSRLRIDRVRDFVRAAKEE